MRNPFKFSLEDEREEKEDYGDGELPDGISQDHMMWIAGAMAKMYLQMAQAQRSGDSASEGEPTAGPNVATSDGEFSGAGEASGGEGGSEIGGSLGSGSSSGGGDFSAGGFWGSGGNF